MTARKRPTPARPRPQAPPAGPEAGRGQPSPSEGTRANVGGRPPIEVTPDHLRQIEQLAGYGLTQAAIASVIGISHDTFTRRKETQEEVLRALEKGLAKAQGIIGQSLFNKAKGGDLGSIVWWEKTRAGRVDSSQVRHADAKGENLPAPQVIFYTPDNGRGVRPPIAKAPKAGANGHRPR